MPEIKKGPALELELDLGPLDYVNSKLHTSFVPGLVLYLRIMVLNEVAIVPALWSDQRKHA